MSQGIKNKTASSKALLAVQASLVVLIIYLSVRGIIAFISPQSLWNLPVQTSKSFTAQTPRSAQNYDFSFDPFHRDVPAAQVQVGEDAPETTLNLKLFGLRAGESGSAVLQTPDNKQAVYRIGDEVINGVTLKSISPNFIVLSINGKLERLTFARNQESALRAAPRKDIASEGLRVSAESFMREVEIKSVAVEGGGRGYQVSPRFGAAKLDKYGLENGDILLALGSTDLTAGQPNWPQIARNISSSGEIRAKINRGGNVMNVKATLK